MPSKPTMSNSAYPLDDKPSITFADLPSSIVATIFSFDVASTREYARLRLISSKITSDVMPLVFTSARNSVKGSGSFIRCCYGGMHNFLSEMTSIDEESHRTGCRWNFPDGSYSLFEGSVMQSIFITDEFNGAHTNSTKMTNIQHANLCHELYNAADVNELLRLDGVARGNGAFLPMSIPTATASESKCIRPDITDTDDTMIEDLHFNAIVTLIVPHNAHCVHQRDATALQLKPIVPENEISEWVERKSEYNEDIFFLPCREDEGGLFLGHVIHTSHDRSIVRVVMRVRSFEDAMWDLEFSGSSCELLFLTALWKKYQERMLVSEGVAIADGILSSNSKNHLMGLIDKLDSMRAVHDHPHSNDIVRDLVHPALYSHVKGASTEFSLEKGPPCNFICDTILNESENMMKNDYGGSEGSEYQWLPTYFDVGVDGSCSICDYINNLVPREEHFELYSALENLFSQALPLLESVYSYGREVEPRLRHDRDCEEDHWCEDLPSPIEEKYYPLRGRRLQVITKIVDYELESGQSYESDW